MGAAALTLGVVPVTEVAGTSDGPSEAAGGMSVSSDEEPFPNVFGDDSSPEEAAFSSASDPPLAVIE